MVPQGSALSGGGTVNWEDVVNVTALIQLPLIANVSAATYCVVSVMEQNGAVLQAAFGEFPGRAGWQVYAMYIRNLNHVPQEYSWVLNGTAPAAGPGDVVEISIYQAAGGAWDIRASDLNASASVEQPFGGNNTGPLREGDQEVFALESYSFDSGTFSDMGNMTLLSLALDGRGVVSGWYAFADWDMVHNPLFTVGGATPISAVGVDILGRGRAVWYYSGSWQETPGVGEGLSFLVAMVTVLGAALAGVLISARLIRRTKGGPEAGEAPEAVQNRPSG